MPPDPPCLTRYELDAPVTAHDRALDNTYELTLHAPQIAQAAQPGQFVELLFGENYAPLLRRPFSLFGVDRALGTIRILYRAHGSFTNGLMQKRVGDRVSVLGPLGQPFRWTPDPNVRHLLIAGGIGVPPLAFLASEMSRAFRELGLSTQNLLVINAARTAELLIGLSTFENLTVELITVTDDGSHGRQGIASELLSLLLDESDAPPARVYACGPMLMLRALGELCVARNVPCRLSVETAMPCGIGTCWGCAIPVRSDSSPEGFVYARACYEGPVFEASELLWNV